MRVLSLLRDMDASTEEISGMVMAKPERVSAVLDNLQDMGILAVKDIGGGRQVFTRP
ncbi:MAG: hypothetical protein V3R82_07235 [Candidatus Hydrothermarchaeales archaeon]